MKSTLRNLFDSEAPRLRSELTVFSIGIALLACFLLLSSCSQKPAQCPLCARDIHQGMQVKITHHGIPFHTCCMACALTYKKQATDVEIVSATDFLTGSAIDPKNAYYVIGSEISPCIQDPKVQKFIREPHSALHECYDRCEPGILAFRNLNDAEKFKKDHGGSIHRFQDFPDTGVHHD